jgi:hypothetical protein
MLNVAPKIDDLFPPLKCLVTSDGVLSKNLATDFLMNAMFNGHNHGKYGDLMVI